MDYYVILGLRPGADEGQIKRAYRRLARKYHPDINPGDRTAEALFRRIVEAYETLIDPARRTMYDTGRRPAAEASAPLSFEGFDFSVVGDEMGGGSAATFGELFADVFRRSAGLDQERPVPGADLHVSVSLSFEEAARGAERTMTLTRQDACGVCQGSGVLRTAEGQCLQCHGRGSIRWTRGHMVFSRACTACGGSGRLGQQRCTKCAGQGVVAKSDVLAVRLPSGIADGARVRLAGQGHAGRFGAPAGELVVEVHVAPHPLFQRQGDDLFLVVPIAVHEAALGAKIDVPTLDGPARLRVPPGTQAGQRFRLRGRGLPARDGRTGDLVVEARIVVPPLRDERSKELMREFAQLNPANVRKELGV
jgi:molecular chaperone DnaJ